MARTIWQYDALIPTGTSASDLATIDLGLANTVVKSIDIQVPPGPLGVMSFAIYRADTPVIPRQLGQFFTWDDHYASWDLEDYGVGAGWRVIGYNTGTYNHTVYLTFHTDPIEVSATQSRFTLEQYQGEDFDTYDRGLLS